MFLTKNIFTYLKAYLEFYFLHLHIVIEIPALVLLHLYHIHASTLLLIIFLVYFVLSTDVAESTQFVYMCLYTYLNYIQL